MSNLPPHAANVKFKFFHKFCRLNVDFEFNVNSAATPAAAAADERSGSSWGSLRKSTLLLGQRTAKRAAALWRRDALGLVLRKPRRSFPWERRTGHRCAFS